MARKPAGAKNGAAAEAPPKPTPQYHVVRVDGDTLTIIARDVTAKDHDAAMDQTVMALPAAQQAGKFGAFTVRNFKTEDYEAATETVLRRGGRVIAKKGAAEPIRN